MYMDMDMDILFYLFGVEVLDAIARHVFCETYRLEAEGNGLLDDFLEGIFCMARAELARVGMHCEGHLV